MQLTQLECKTRSVRFSLLVVLVSASVLNVQAEEKPLAESLWKYEDPTRSCGGSYDISLIETQGVVDSSEGEARLTADRAVVRLDGESEVSGNVVLKGRGANVSTPFLRLNSKGRILQTPDGATMVHNDIVLTVDQSDIRVDEQSFDIDNAQFVMLNEGYRGTAQIFSADDSAVEIEQATITWCPPVVDSWSLGAKHLRIDRTTNMVVARNVRLNLWNLPAIYVPYARFPIDNRRASGILLPEYESDSLHGNALSVPIYFNLAPNFDLTVTPTLSTKRNHSIAVEFRHLSRTSKSTITGTYLPSDHVYKNYVAELLRQSLVADEGSGKRWLVELQHDFAMNRWVADVEYTLVSDTDFQRDYGESLNDLGQVGLSRILRLWRWGSTTNIGLELERYDPFQFWGTSVEKLPEVVFGWEEQFGPLQSRADLSWARLAHDDGLQVRSIDRSYGDFSLSLPLSTSWGHGAVEVVQSSKRYESSDESVLNQDFRTVVLDLGIAFDRMDSNGSAVHSLEPRLVYVRRPVEGQSEFSFSDFGPISPTIASLVQPHRTASRDWTEALDAVSLSVMMRFNNLGRGRSIVSILPVVLLRRDGDETDFGLDNGWGIEATGRFSSELSIVGFHLRNPDRWTTQATGIAFKYLKPLADVNFHVRHEQPRDLFQSYLDTSVALSQKWHLYGRVNYEWNERRHIDSFVGFEYSGCCIEYRLLWRKSLRYEFFDWENLRSRTGIYFEISLTGLTSFGDNISSVIEKGRRKGNWKPTFVQ